MTTATERHQLHLPFVLSSISPSLAALHASRTHLLHPTDTSLSASHCPRCGVLMVDGGRETRFARLRGKHADAVGDEEATSFRRSMIQSCGRCGYRRVSNVDSHNARLFPPPRKQKPKGVIPKHAKSDANNRVDTQNSSSILHERLLVPPTHPPPSRSEFEATIDAHASAVSSSHATHVPTPLGRSKGRTKKSALQEMLIRNKKRQDEAKESKSHGLSTFLQKLS